MMRAPILALLLLAAAASVSGRGLLQSGNSACPAGCASDGCVRDTTSGGYRCIKCEGTLVVQRATGRCGCPAGKYASAADACSDCGAGYFCPGGEYSSAGASAMGRTACTNQPTEMTTLGTRSSSIAQCVNKPGYKYNVGSNTATQCLANTYSTGLKKQPACTPCPPGMTSAIGSTSAEACIVPAGYYLKAPGQVAICPQGEWNDGTGIQTACTRCAAGVTTSGPGATAATACALLEPGYYAYAMTGQQVTDARLCPMGYVCAGGDPSAAWVPTAGTTAPATGSAAVAGAAICANGRWTRGLGAIDATECMVPPGYGTTANNIEACGTGLYREGWVYTTTNNKPCLYCSGLAATQSPDFSSSQNTALTLYTGGYSGATPSTVTIMVADTRQGSCYVLKGQGVYQTGADTFRVTTCSGNRYGVADNTTGVSLNPCRDCPAGMVTTSQTPAPSGGFYAITQCLTQAGWGYNGRVASKCPIGYYNAAGNQNPCSWCGYGLTTAAVESSADTQCILAAGYGSDGGSPAKVVLCPAGKWSAGSGANTTECTACGTGSTTAEEGSIASTDCKYCEAGYGGTSCGACAVDTYGLAGVEKSTYGSTACTSCPAMTQGYAFTFEQANYNYSAASISPASSKTRGDCLAAFTQAVDDASFIRTALANSTTTISGSTHVARLASCVGTCTGSCMLVTYTYTTDPASSSCVKVDGAPYTGTQGTVVAWKAAPAGDLVATAGERTKADALASGRYTFWKITYDTNAATTFPDNASGGTVTAAACLAACDDSPNCAGVTYTVPSTYTLATTTVACTLINANPTIANSNQRSLTRTVLDQLSAPTA